MDILHQELRPKGRFYTDDKLAEIVYSWFSDTGIIIEHTEVDESLKGQGVGNKLVAAVVGWARTHNLKIIPLCPFAKVVFQRKKEYEDVLFQS